MAIHMIHKCSPNETILNPTQWPKMPRELEVPTTRHRTFNRQTVSREIFGHTVVGRNSSVSNPNQLHVDIFHASLIF